MENEIKTPLKKKWRTQKAKLKKNISNKKAKKRNKLILLFIMLLVILLFYKIVFYLIKKKINKTNLSNYNNKTDSSIKVGMCTLCKSENLYIKEFIDYHRDLGYNHIFIYDNNDIDGERLEDVIQKEIDEGYVSIINYRGDKNRQIFRIYIDCYEKNNKNYDWLSFFDIDEFLELKPKGIKIQELLNNERYKDCQNVKFNWLVYSDNEKLRYRNIPVQKRFKTPSFSCVLNNHVKTTVRGNLLTNYWVNATNPHTGENNYNCCSSSGKQISKNSPYNQPYDYEYGYIKHYRTKTIEEYINKIKRGKPDGHVSNEYMITMFFYSNKRTKKKLDIFNKELNL